MRAPIGHVGQDFPLGQWVIFSDLDGTLLDVRTYRPSPEAVSTVRELATAGVSLVPVSSKTAAEVRPLMDELGLQGPAIVEGGAVTVDRVGHALPVGPTRSELIAVLHELSEVGFPVRGFSDMTVRELAERAGLSSDAAVRANTRSASEPFVVGRELDPGSERTLRREAAARGCQVTRGGRFWHLMGESIDKGRGVVSTLQQWPVTVRGTAAVGDAWNDLPMLAVTDEAFLLGDLVADQDLPHGSTRVKTEGPAGFVTAIQLLAARWRLRLDSS